VSQGNLLPSRGRCSKTRSRDRTPPGRRGGLDPAPSRAARMLGLAAALVASCCWAMWVGPDGGACWRMRTGHASIQGSIRPPHAVPPAFTADTDGAVRAAGRIRRCGTTCRRRRRAPAIGSDTPLFYSISCPTQVHVQGDSGKSRLNDFGYDWHPKITGTTPYADVRGDGRRARYKGHDLRGTEPATSLNAGLERMGMRKLEWLVVKDNWLLETATFWDIGARGGARRDPSRRTFRPRSFLIPSAQVAETDGASPTRSACCSGTSKPADPPGSAAPTCGSRIRLAKRLKRLYGASTAALDYGFQQLTCGVRPR